MKNKNHKNFLYNMIGSTVNSLISLFLLIIVTRINGIEDAGIFSFAFAISCLLQVIGNYSGRAYQVTEPDDNILDSDYIYNKIICCLFMLFSCFIFVLIRDYSFNKIIIIILLVIYKMIESFSEVIYAIIQKNDDLYKVGISLFLKGILGTFIFLFVDLIFYNLFISIISIIFLNLIIIYIYDFKNIKLYSFKLSKYNKKNVKLIFKFGFATFLFTILTQYLINSSKYAIDLSLSDKYQTIFGIIVMPATIIGLCVQFMIHPLLNKLVNLFKTNNIEEFNKVIIKLSLSTLVVGIFACLIAYYIGIPFLNFIYGIQLIKYKIDLVIILIGASFFGISCVISNALIVLRDTKSQVLIYLIVSVFAYFISNFLVLKSGVHGASLAYMIIMMILMIFYLTYFFIKNLKSKSTLNNCRR